MYNFEVFL